jgi:autophagy-related protein 13
VILDDQGKRWDVAEALNSSDGSSDGNSRHRKNHADVVLERWKIELKDGVRDQDYDFGAILPTVYKKCIVFFRSLYSTTKFVPTWRFVKTVGKSSTSSGLRVNCRIIRGDEFQSRKQDPLTHPLYDTDSPVTTTFPLGETDSPAGRFSAEICYRNECNFRVDDSEALLSSRFMGADEHFFQPSLGTAGDQRRRATRTEVGSLPAHRQRLEETEPTQAYGSMSTFHGDAPPLGSSPISALRAARYIGSDSGSSPTSSAPQSHPMQASRPSSTRPLEGLNMARRPSLSFQPFKAGSLSASPGSSNPLTQLGEMLPPSSPHSLSRNSGISALTQARNRSSLTSGMPSTLRGVPIVHENAVASSASSSPKPAPINRFSSSFSHRRNRQSFGGASKVDDDQGSSGKQSLSSSSAQPGSGILADVGAGGSSGSLQTDDDNISDFLKLLDSKKTLKSFDPSQGEASTKRTSAQLSKFQSMRESNNALTESMSQSMLMHRSSSSSSRQLSSVPPMVGATSMSTSSSPGKPVSPHTPHTPAIPSRLSAGSIAEYPTTRRFRDRARTEPESRIDDVSGDEDSSNVLGTSAIDIPTSPRPYYPHNRRSSSVAQQHRSVAADDDAGELPFGVHRSISLGAQERDPPSLSALLGIEQVPDTAANPENRERSLQPAALIDESSELLARHSSLSPDQEEGAHPPRSFLVPGSIPYRPRIGPLGGRGVTPPQSGSFASLPDRSSGGGSATSDRPTGSTRYSFNRPTGLYDPDEEPLLFDMSEIVGRDQGRRSLEEGRGRGNTGASNSGNERGGFEGRGGESSSSSRRGSRRW